MDTETVTFLNQLTSRELFETCKKENDEIKHFNFIYNEDTEKGTLIVLCTYKSDPYTQIEVVKADCDALLFSYVLMGIINDPQWITSNPHKPVNVFVETEHIR